MIEIPVEIFGRTVKLICDTGAGPNITSRQFISKLETAITEPADKLVRLRSAFGTSVIASEQVRLPLRFVPTNPVSAAHTIEADAVFLIADGFPYDLLMGTRFMRQLQATIDVGRNHIILEDRCLIAGSPLCYSTDNEWIPKEHECQMILRSRPSVQRKPPNKTKPPRPSAASQSSSQSETDTAVSSQDDSDQTHIPKSILKKRNSKKVKAASTYATKPKYSYRHEADGSDSSVMKEGTSPSPPLKRKSQSLKYKPLGCGPQERKEKKRSGGDAPTRWKPEEDALVSTSEEDALTDEDEDATVCKRLDGDAPARQKSKKNVEKKRPEEDARARQRPEEDARARKRLDVNMTAYKRPKEASARERQGGGSPARKRASDDAREKARLHQRCPEHRRPEADGAAGRQDGDRPVRRRPQRSPTAEKEPEAEDSWLERLDGHSPMKEPPNGRSRAHRHSEKERAKKPHHHRPDGSKQLRVRFAKSLVVSKRDEETKFVHDNTAKKPRRARKREGDHTRESERAGTSSAMALTSEAADEWTTTTSDSGSSDEGAADRTSGGRSRPRAASSAAAVLEGEEDEPIVTDYFDSETPEDSEADDVNVIQDAGREPRTKKESIVHKYFDKRTHKPIPRALEAPAPANENKTEVMYVYSKASRESPLLAGSDEFTALCDDMRTFVKGAVERGELEVDGNEAFIIIDEDVFDGLPRTQVRARLPVYPVEGSYSGEGMACTVESQPPRLHGDEAAGGSSQPGASDSMINGNKTQKQDLQFGEGITKEEKTLMTDLFRSFDSAMSKGQFDVGETHLVKHPIDTGDAAPIALAAHRINQSQRDELWRQLQVLIEVGFIRESNSPWAAPIVLVKKKDGSWRLCIDHRELNKVTKKNATPLPRIDDISDHLAGAQYFTSLDFCCGYHHVRLADDACEKTAFTTPFGLFEWTRMTFGLCNAPATFQQLMNRILKDALGKFVMCYLDDIIIYSKTFEQHLKNTQWVLSKVNEAGMKMKMSKCVAAARSITYLGSHISGDGVATDPEKVRAVTEWQFPLPDERAVKAFLGLVGYYRKFIKNFAHEAYPLTKLTRHGEPFVMGPEQEAAFKSLQLKLVTAPILAHPDFDKPFLIYTDASGYGIGALLKQLDECGRERVVAYTSRTLQPLEMKYPTTHKECLAIIYGIEQFRYYVAGRKFSVVTDHHSLCYLMKVRKPYGRLTHWALRLQDYDFEIIYKPGSSHKDADALSRYPIGYDRLTERTEIDYDEDTRDVCAQANNHPLENMEQVEAARHDGWKEPPKPAASAGEGAASLFRKPR